MSEKDNRSIIPLLMSGKWRISGVNLHKIKELLLPRNLLSCYCARPVGVPEMYRRLPLDTYFIKTGNI